MASRSRSKVSKDYLGTWGGVLKFIYKFHANPRDPIVHSGLFAIAD